MLAKQVSSVLENMSEISIQSSLTPTSAVSRKASLSYPAPSFPKDDLQLVPSHFLRFTLPFFFFQLQLTYNIVLVSGVQDSNQTSI